MSSGGGPLAGVRVLDLTRLLPGPVATLHLADLGADVVKIEDMAAGDYARTMGEGPEDGPEAGGTAGSSRFFRAVNRNKRGLRLDLKDPRGRAVFLRLAQGADAIVESFRPGVVDKLGVGYEAVRAINPRIVYCAITGYGQNGPWALRAGHDLNYIAQAGVLDQIGAAQEGQPAIPNLQIGDLLGGAMTGVMGILAALYDAQRSGQGRYVDVAMADSVLAHHLFPLFAHQSASGLAPRGADMLTGGDAGYGVYRTQDGRYLAVAPLEAKFWQLFCDTLGRPDLKPRHGAVGEAAQALRRELEAIFAARPQAYWNDKFAGVDCCVTPVLSLDEALTHPQYAARGMVLESDGMRQYAPPLKLSGWSFAVGRAAPAPGEHSAEILREAGFSGDEIEALRQAEIV